MSWNDSYRAATLAGEATAKKHGITKLPVCPFALARSLDIEVRAKPESAGGVSGMLLRQGDQFGIAYATHIDSVGFQRFSIAHELGHYLLPGHIDAVLDSQGTHQSCAGFGSRDRYEIEADHFAAGLLMPMFLFGRALRDAGDGLDAVRSLSDQCLTSLTATAIRYAQCTRDPLAIVVSTGERINYCFMSDGLKELEGLNWIRKNQPLSENTATFAFNRNKEPSSASEQVEDSSNLQDWFGGARRIDVTEEVVGLGQYGKTLTVLTIPDLPDPDEMDEEDDLIESWTPKFHRR